MTRAKLQIGRGQWNHGKRLLHSAPFTLLWLHRLYLYEVLLTLQSGLSADKQGPEVEEDRIPQEQGFFGQ